jgi:hypothetical protein
MLMTHMRHGFHNAIGKQYRDATKFTGQLNEMAACEHGDIGLGAGSSSEMEQLRVLSSEKRKQRDFRTGAGPMAIGLVLPTTNATSLVVVAVVTAATSARQEAIATKTETGEVEAIATRALTSHATEIEKGVAVATRTETAETETAATAVTGTCRLAHVSPQMGNRIFGRAGSIRRHRREGKATSRAAERLPRAQGYSPENDAKWFQRNSCV